MKKPVFILMVLFAGLSVSAMAEEDAPGKKNKMMMHQQPSVTATTDGGVVVLAGPRLLKYDSQLNLIGEAELKMGPKPGARKSEEGPAGESVPAEGAPDAS